MATPLYSIAPEDCKHERMEVVDTVEHYHNPGDQHGYGEITGKILECPDCGHTEEYEKDYADSEE